MFQSKFRNLWASSKQVLETLVSQFVGGPLEEASKDSNLAFDLSLNLVQD